MPKVEYHEGPEAQKKVEDLVAKLFRAPNTAAKESPKPEVRKPKKASKG